MNGSLDLMLLNIGFSELNADWNWKQVYSPFARIYYVKGGKAKTYIRGKTCLLEPGHLYLTPPFSLHDDECDGYFSLYYIHLYEKTINRESIFDRYDFPVDVQASDLDLLLIERLMEINPNRHLRHFDPKVYDNIPTFSQYIADNNRMSIHSIVETQGILYQFISRFLETATIKQEHADIRIHKSLQYIHENIDKTISISELAGISCITEDHFIRTFKKEMKQTPLKYINTKKIEKAQLLLLTTGLPVREIAMELSMDNISYFNRVFRQHAGTTPCDYRKKYSK
ncbi:MAG: AraC family transcriptional regulator [Dysgonamonadaceae bacterium]|jgi:AraC-like DNA-binding protein|nr:AraC family transcriptional regulator [Dysgonamonadaceae bacterium]